MSASSAGSRDRLQSLILGAVLVVVAVLVLFVLRPGGASQPAGDPDAPAGASSPTEQTAPPPVTEPGVATDEEFCAAFVALADSQAQFAGGTAGAEGLLAEAADALVAGGVPASMSLPARSGYHALVAGVYESIGQQLSPAAVGAPSAPVDGGAEAFSAHLGQHCPA